MTLVEKILEAHHANPKFNRTAFAKKHGTECAYIRKVIRKSKRGTIEQGQKPLEEKVDFNHTSKGTAKLDTEGTTFTTLEEALRGAKVDLTEWKVDRYTIGSWQVTLKLKDKGVEYDKTVTMYKIQVWLKRLENLEFVHAIRALIKEVPKMKTPKARKYVDDGDFMLEIALHDIHWGMLAWDKESGYDYDLDITEHLYLNAVDDLLQKGAGYKPSRILFPFGNDFLHIDDPTNATPQNRNPLDVDSRLIKIYQKAKKSVIEAIDRCRKIAPVDVVWVPGNHDPSVSYYMCDVLDEVFSKDPGVSVNKSPKTRKYYPWGKGLVAFTHGIEEPINELPQIVATEEPEMWGNSRYREIHIGHKHKKMEMKWIGLRTKPGAIVRMIPSIATADAWHYKKGFIRSYHAAEAYLWDKNHGMVGQFTTFADYERIKDAEN
jgi:hypothetical protein